MIAAADYLSNGALGGTRATLSREGGKQVGKGLWGTGQGVSVQNERRKHRRVGRHFDGTWQGGGGARRCRIADVSVGGCFVHGMIEPAIGEPAEITIDLEDGTLTAKGTVAYVERGMGFAVRFEAVPEDVRQAIERLVGAVSRGDGRQ